MKVTYNTKINTSAGGRTPATACSPIYSLGGGCLMTRLPTKRVRILTCMVPQPHSFNLLQHYIIFYYHSAHLLQYIHISAWLELQHFAVCPFSQYLLSGVYYCTAAGMNFLLRRTCVCHTRGFAHNVFCGAHFRARTSVGPTRAAPIFFKRLQHI